MKHRTAALQKLAEGIDGIVATHAESLSKSNPIESTKESTEKYEVEEDLPEGHSEEEEEAGAEEKLASGGASVTPLPTPESEPVPEPQPEEDEMSQAKKHLADRLSKKPMAIRRG